MAAISSSQAAERAVDLTLIHTTDVHGNFFPRDYINRRPGVGSLSRVYTYVDSLRQAKGRENVILVDAGDILQGQPTVYYYNFVDTVTPHVASSIYNFMDYDAITIGNHDVETGHDVYDRFNAGLSRHLLGANVINTATGEPYFEPYRIINRGGVKIAILGLLTPAIPAWLPENLWSGLRFDDMVESARRWIPIIKAKENPDLIIGLFHSGNDANRRTGDYLENASVVVAKTVPGFDIVLTGHDHTRFNRIVMNSSGDSVLVLNPANNAENLTEITMNFKLDEDGKVVERHLRGNLIPINSLQPSETFLTQFANPMQEVETYVSHRIGTSEGEFTTREAFFGPSSFIRLIHDLQLKISGADISMAAPLSYDATINKGDIRISDMFNLYKYENLLYTIAMTGREIKNYLEESYRNWTETMKPGDEHILIFSADAPSAKSPGLKNATYNFDSAAGINYTVDVTRQPGDKVNIISMEDGTPFDMDKTYEVAVNSYRGNGGGDLLTRGAGIPHDQLPARILRSTDRDMRFYLIKEIEAFGTIAPRNIENWQFIPREIVEPAIENDMKIIFPK